MAHHDIKLEGLAEFQKGLAKRVELEDMKRIIKTNGSQLQRKAQRNADFKKGYQTGATKRSIGLELKDNDLTAVVQPTTEYAAYVEYGTRFMDSQPFMRPAYVDQLMKFKNDVNKLIK